MPGFVFIVAFVVILILVFSRAKNQRPRQRPLAERVYDMRPPAYDAAKLPEQLGIRAGIPLASMEKRLAEAMDTELLRKMRARIKDKYPSMDDAEYACKLLELKRYFMMTAVLDQVPMYSESVDTIWHEMLMFTREYSVFCEGFIGTAIHHAPHDDGGRPEPGEKAWFDWIYTHLFEPTPYSASVWNGFFQVALPEKRLLDFKHLSENELAGRYFNGQAAARFGEIGETVRVLIGQLKDQIHYAENSDTYEPYRSSGFYSDPLLYLAGGAVFYSLMGNSDAFQTHMEGLRQDNAPYNGSDGGSFSPNVWDSGNDGSGSGSSDGGGGSACSGGGSSSSCGGGSSSSCGGGSSSSCGGGS